jgi:hypothetical protein
MTPNNEALNQPKYPLTGGIKPSTPGYPVEMNPEIIRLQQELVEANHIITEKITEINTLKLIIDERQRQLDAYHEIILALAKKN